MEELLAAIGSLHFDGCVRFWDAAVFDYQAGNDDAAAGGDVVDDDDGYSAAADIVGVLVDLPGGRAGYGV